MADLRDQYLERVVKDKTFAELGGLWGTVNEKVSVAARAGATELTMIDVTPEDSELWQKFHDRMKALKVTQYHCVCNDAVNLNNVSYDVVHCSGVLYHHPNPLYLLGAIRRMTKAHAVLTSAIIQETVQNERGVYRLPTSGVLFVPALNDTERAVLAGHWKAAGAHALGISERVSFQLDEFGPWWWLPTVTAMRAMCEASGFRILEGDYTWNGNAYTVLLGAA